MTKLRFAGWLAMMVRHTNPEVRRKGKEIRERLRREAEADWEALRRSPCWRGR